MPFLQYIYSLPAEQLAHIVLSCFVTIFTGTSLMVIMYTCMDIKEKKEEEQQEKKDKTIVYGIKETAVTIQHQYLNKDDEEFLRHVRALSNVPVQTIECMEILDNFSAFLKLHNHHNSYDIRVVRRLLQTEVLNSAFLWLKVAQAFWILHPWDEMLPYVMWEYYENSDTEVNDNEAIHKSAEGDVSPSLVQT
jgi:hypothetical protein